MKIKQIITEILCFLLSVNFFYEGIYKFAYLEKFEYWITHKPFISEAGKILTYAIPLGEIILSILLLIPSKKLLGLRIIIVSQLIFIFSVFGLFLFTDYIIWPYHSLWKGITWAEKMIFALGLIWLSVLILLLSTRKKILHATITSFFLKNKTVLKSK